MNMGFIQPEIPKIATSSQPGFQLLYNAFEQKRLDQLCNSCRKMKLEDLPHQIRANQPLLHSTVTRQEKDGRQTNGATVARLSPVSTAHLNPDLMRVRISDSQMIDWIRNRSFTEERKKQLEELIYQATDRRPDGHMLGSGFTNTFYTYEEQRFGGGLTPAKWLHFLNTTGGLDMLSFARNVVEKLEQADIELDAEQWTKLAEGYVKTDRNKALRMLLARDNIGYRDQLSAWLAHGHDGRGGLRIKCEGNNCAQSVQRGWDYISVRKCDHLPTLQQEAERLGLTPFSFRPDKG